MTKPKYHVQLSIHGGWIVRKERDSFPIMYCEERSEAIRRGRAIALHGNGDLYIHDASGLVQKKIEL